MRSFHRLRFVRVVLFMLASVASMLATTHEAFAKPVFPVMYLGGLAQAVPASREQVSTATQLGAFTPDALLVARTDGAPLLLATRPIFGTTSMRDASVAFDAEAERTAPVRYGLGFSKPDRWTSIIVTLALCLFFFVRRMV